MSRENKNKTNECLLIGQRKKSCFFSIASHYSPISYLRQLGFKKPQIKMKANWYKQI